MAVKPLKTKRWRKKIMVFDKVKELIVDQLGVDEDIVTSEASIQEELGADSLDIVDLIQTIEDEYDLSIPDEAVESIKTVGDIVAYIENNTEA
jgi:acyl carrier protein